jgi:hypothetical protein
MGEIFLYGFNNVFTSADLNGTQIGVDCRQHTRYIYYIFIKGVEALFKLVSRGHAPPGGEIAVPDRATCPREPCASLSLPSLP